MSTVSSRRTLTATELLALNGPARTELIEGVLHEMPPASGDHGRVALTVGGLLRAHAAETGGAAFAAETGFRLQAEPDTVRAPDAAYVTPEHAARVGRSPGFWPGAPDLAVEVVSPNDTYSELQAKALGWLEHGSGVVLVIDPDARRVTRYRATDDIVVLSGGQAVDCAPAAPGFAPTVAELLAR